MFSLRGKTVGKIFDAIEKSKVENKGKESTNRGIIIPIDKNVDRLNPALNELSPNRLNDIDKNLVTFLKPNSYEAEQFKILRTNILFPNSGKPPRSILITSALPGEGKSFIASNLAVSLAQNIDEYVLLIDCDIRNPTIHSTFGFVEVSGLSEYLSDKIPINNLLLKTKLKKLSILPAGKPPKNPSELLSSLQMLDLIKEVRERYSDRYIILDSPPPQLTAETNAIASQVDGIILVIKYGSTPRKMVTKMVEEMKKDKIIGIIINYSNSGLPRRYAYGKYSSDGQYYEKYKKTSFFKFLKN